ncbi:nitronate monooxygenase family protein [Streptomyces sp. BK340]|uniref:NAD(P)H-dependent flavin oxidoreductase n=1 Tax=Streptomyces sp. BK340 TaxID=2572903 RepID=UPI00119DAC0F|nr:nitronate monooxygenase [Streptomyces sp. BK340]TVZ76743.1 nitronate monooxygenase [Streptomyces sp. BK340]
MSIQTVLTAKLGIEHPVILAPMGLAAGGLLARTVSEAGGLGMISGGYADYNWLAGEYAATEGTKVGCGFINWMLKKDPSCLYRALDELRPPAVLLSFGDSGPFPEAVKRSGALLMMQLHTLAEAERALDLGADVIIAQGTEAGGHGIDNQATFTLVPSVVDLVSDRAPGTPVVAAGGIADGRGIAAALALGADGVMMGTRFWATRQALVSEAAWSRLVEATGDDTVRTSVDDVVSGHAWPAPYTNRVLRNSFTDRWHGAEEALYDRLGIVRQQYEQALEEGDFDLANVPGGQNAGLIHSVESADDVLRKAMFEAEEILARLTPRQPSQPRPEPADATASGAAEGDTHEEGA